MNEPLLEGWTSRNQRQLVRDLDRVRRALEAYAATRSDDGSREEPRPAPASGNSRWAASATLARVAPTAARGGGSRTGPDGPWDGLGGGEPHRAADRDREMDEAESSALEVLVTAFGLSGFERDLLLLCAGVELDAAFGPLCASLHGEALRVHPTFGLALAALPDAHWTALAPGAPLRHWRLVQVGAAEALTAAPLRIDERILHFLAGLNELDERLRGHLQPVRQAGELTGTQADLAMRIASLWAEWGGGEGLPVVVLTGVDRLAKPSVATEACARLGLTLHRVRAGELPSSVEEREAFTRLWEREAILGGVALFVDCESQPGGEEARVPAGFIDRIATPVIVASREPLPDLPRSVAIEVARPTATEQRELWRATLGEAAARLNGQLDEVVAQFDLSAQTIRAAGRRALADGVPLDDPGMPLWDVCRAHARPRLEDLATRLTSRAAWDDLVLPDAQRDVLRAIAAHVRNRAQVYQRWGFADRSPRGLGISALFAGPSGTGKTLAAEVLARELRLDLYRIDLSSVVSKYIGETEKNLRRVFDAAEEGGAILLFDEADAIFGKRSEVKDSHDRYANLEVSYLLQRMEAYRGLAILTTNFQEALDQAFVRRIRFIVHFPFPGREERRRIWSRIFPAATPTSGLDVDRLARLSVAGGTIRNIALGAAFLAAESEEVVGMAHLLDAARLEFDKLERPIADTEVQGWR